MIKVSRFWDIGESGSKIPNLGNGSLARIFRALIKCGGKLHAYCVEAPNNLPDSQRLVSYRISLPIGQRLIFENLSGYKLVTPTVITGDFND